MAVSKRATLRKALAGKLVAWVPSTPPTVPAPFPPEGKSGPRDDDRAMKNFLKLGNAYTAEIDQHKRAAKRTAEIMGDVAAFVLNGNLAFAEVDTVMARIDKLKDQQHSILFRAKAMEKRIDKGFKDLDKLAAKGDPKKIERAKTELIGKGQALMAMVFTLQGLNKQALSEQAALERALAKISDL